MIEQRCQLATQGALCLGGDDARAPHHPSEVPGDNCRRDEAQTADPAKQEARGDRGLLRLSCELRLCCRGLPLLLDVRGAPPASDQRNGSHDE